MKRPYNSSAAMRRQWRDPKGRAKLLAKPRGHWPKGKRKSSADPARVKSTLALVGRVLDHPKLKVRSLRTAARACGVHERSVRRWLAGYHLPMSYRLSLLSRWTQRQWREIKQAEGKA